MRRPKPYPPELSWTPPPDGSRTTDAGAGRDTCCISRRDDRLIGAVSGPSCGGHAERKTPTQRLKSRTDVSIPPIDPNEPLASRGSAFQTLSSQRYPRARRVEGTIAASSVGVVMLSGVRWFSVLKSAY